MNATPPVLMTLLMLVGSYGFPGVEDKSVSDVDGAVPSRSGVVNSAGQYESIAPSGGQAPGTIRGQDGEQHDRGSPAESAIRSIGATWVDRHLQGAIPKAIHGEEHHEGKLVQSAMLQTTDGKQRSGVQDRSSALQSSFDTQVKSQDYGGHGSGIPKSGAAPEVFGKGDSKRSAGTTSNDPTKTHSSGRPSGSYEPLIISNRSVIPWHNFRSGSSLQTARKKRSTERNSPSSPGSSRGARKKRDTNCPYMNMNGQVWQMGTSTSGQCSQPVVMVFSGSCPFINQTTTDPSSSQSSSTDSTSGSSSGTTSSSDSGSSSSGSGDPTSWGLTSWNPSSSGTSSSSNSGNSDPTSWGLTSWDPSNSNSTSSSNSNFCNAGTCTPSDYNCMNVTYLISNLLMTLRHVGQTTAPSPNITINVNLQNPYGSVCNTVANVSTDSSYQS